MNLQIIKKFVFDSVENIVEKGENDAFSFSYNIFKCRLHKDLIKFGIVRQRVKAPVVCQTRPQKLMA